MYIPWLALSFIPCIRSSDHAWFNHLLGTDIFGRPTSFYSNSAEQLLSTTLGIAVQHLHHHRVRFLSSLSRLKAVVGEGYWLPLDNAYSSPSEIGDLFIEVAASLSRCRAGEGVSIGCPILLDLSIGYWWILIHFERAAQRRSAARKYLRQSVDNSSNSWRLIVYSVTDVNLLLCVSFRRSYSWNWKKFFKMYIEIITIRWKIDNIRVYLIYIEYRIL